ncbi:MAG: hypothetical protein GYA43_01550 [Bacteroidales bacterium]|nr:hypothetical protein [Bacteroidales bacterium]
MLSLLGFSGGILHILNHSLFKSLLFFSAGSVYQAAHTRNIELLGGLMKQMPFTAMFFLAGSIAICGLPPFNGFVSEYLIYSGMFKSLPSSGLLFSIMLLLSITGLVLIGGLAVFCFTKAFGIVFLGQARSDKASAAVEVSRSMILPQVFTLALIMLIGLAPVLFVKPVFNIVSSSLMIKADDFAVQFFPANLVKISIASGIFVLVTVILLLWRSIHMKRVAVSTGPTWGCGYAAVSSKQQYTATSYTYNYNHLASPVLRTRKYMEELGEDELFPRNRTFESHSSDVFRKYLIDKPSESLSALLKRLAVMQTGEIRHYILYAFVFILLVTLLAYFKII